MKSQTPSRNPVEAALAQAAIDNAISLTPDFQTELDYRLRMVSSAIEHLALHETLAVGLREEVKP